ncbi:hypothetical protein I4U23_009776 [Adineta vaga]|nr:hypothetical protein I4U23_009776 [Adineta vaga]
MNMLFGIVFCHLLWFEIIVTKNTVYEIDQQEDNELILTKRFFENKIENQREYVTTISKRRRLARMKFEEHCEPQGKILNRICPTLEQCLSTHDQISPREIFQEIQDANQFLKNTNIRKRFFLSSFFNSKDDYNERFISERRHKGFVLYEDYCESTDRLSRSCPALDRCQCGDCNN